MMGKWFGKIKKKRAFLLLGLVGSVLLLVLLLANSSRRYHKAKEVLENYREAESAASTEEAQQDEVTDEETAEETESVTEETRITITNLNEKAETIMGTKTSLLEEKLTNYVVAREDLSAVTAGEIIEVWVPSETPESTEFYVALDDSTETVVKLVWYATEKEVVAVKSIYTKADIASGILSGSEPTTRDVSAEEDTAFLQGQ